MADKPRSLNIPIDQIRTDGNTQVRVKIDDERTAHYAERLQAGDKFPPIVVFDDGENGYWLADGFHRVSAARKSGKRSCGAEVYKGTREDALWYAAAANRSAGLHMTNADKRRAVTLLLAAMSEKSDRLIADQIGVSHTFVSAIRAELAEAGQVATVATCEGIDGKTYSRTTSDAATTNDANADNTGQAETDETGDSSPDESGITYDDSGEPETPADHPVIAPHAAPAEPTDMEGQVLPADPAIRDAFKRRKELDSLARKVTAVWAEIDKALAANDTVYRYIHTSSVQTGASALAHKIKSAMPHAICPYCQGGAAGLQVRKDCRACMGLGWMPKTQYEMCPDVMRAKREDSPCD